ncbi:ABC transporter [Streptomyces sp. NPDC127098]|uniref:ABC transporter n=1 Tax=Streptomyces sp. NPDC127098 TaxID=3347137 RepID=UPI0036647C34
MRGAIAFEWTKLVSVRSTWWSLVAAGLLTAAASVVVGMSAFASAENGFETARPAPHAVADALMVAQLAVLVPATLAVTGEYASGSIRTSLQSVPVRWRLLLGKAAVVAAVAAVLGVLLSALGTACAAPVMREYGEFTAADAVAAAAGTGGYLSALALMAIGTGTMLRSAAGAITGLVLLQLAVPQLLRAIGAGWLAAVADHLPSTAGLVLITQDHEPYGPGVAVAVLLGWSAAALAAGYAVLRGRDA